VKSYKYIPYPELRRQYGRRCRLRKMLADVVATVVIPTAYGAMVGVMLAGVWITF